MRRFDHIDLRVPNLKEAGPFYRTLLPALGFTRDVTIEGWLQYECESTDDGDRVTEFFGVTESPRFAPNENRIAFWAESPAEVDRLAALLPAMGARNIEGPGYEDEIEPYYAVFFEDPFGNRLEICHRTRNI